MGEGYLEGMEDMEGMDDIEGMVFGSTGLGVVPACISTLSLSVTLNPKLAVLTNQLFVSSAKNLQTLHSLHITLNPTGLT